ncbi:DUF262 domain-containing protein [Wenzhouxiangella sp. AB-CW3]|uniref:GmrSD restriction endonuclease domain-containing protein n=1 Tax=Wenzhouxiangella sp. AB-CW3 TaxID=2771012 RepID=UPI00168B7924|nr:DUF262 domain-containing protein [Wenzhouxiangella sp. AB-CW3]QOC22233.1 DUF262 domain-containing protein [Wenzhouxiangella sp. AB-CW3]
MKIELQEIPVRDLVSDYEDHEEAGVRGYGGKLDIRPPYQREFIYGEKERQAVIKTVTQDFPLNVMYWSVRDDGHFEVIDGQQRTISICQYVEGDFSWNGLYFHNLTDDQQEQILNYKLMVYFCEGTDSERLSWFETINIAGKELTKQELRNAVFAGPWLSDAKKYFSKTDCVAYKVGGDLMKGTPIRQEYLETVIAWKCGDKSDASIRDFMGKNQKKSKANDLWVYFQNVVAWVRATFPVERKKEMKGQPWGILYNQHKDADLDPDALEEQVAKLMADPDVTNKKGIYLFVLNGKEKHLSIRQFDERMRREAFERQKGVCPACNETFTIEEMQADHIKPWHEGGKTEAANCQMLCIDDNRKKGGK